MANSGQSRAVYVRLHLLTGVLALHRGDLCDARSMLLRADRRGFQIRVACSDEACQIRVGALISELGPHCTPPPKRGVPLISHFRCHTIDFTLLTTHS